MENSKLYRTTNYKNAKAFLKYVAGVSKDRNPNDKPAIRQDINDAVDSLSKGYDLSERERNWLSSYACKLHPKD